jgi:16S rRNA (uracil1498-N3)-methyltransferase
MTVELEAGASQHLLRVLRMQPGEEIILFNGSGGEYRAALLRSGTRAARAHVESHHPVEREAGLRVGLGLAVSKGDRMDYAVQKSVELGVAQITPVLAGRTAPRRGYEHWEARREHWRRVAIAACEQCGRNRIPDICAVTDLQDYTKGGAGGLALLLHPGAECSVGDLVAPTLPLATLLIGPEGGWAREEVAFAERQGFLSVRLGPRTLRTETACVVALAALQTLWGDFSSSSRS